MGLQAQIHGTKTAIMGRPSLRRSWRRGSDGHVHLGLNWTDSVMRRPKTGLKYAARMDLPRSLGVDLPRRSKSGLKTALRRELMLMQLLDWRAAVAPLKTKALARVCAWRLAAREPLVGVLRTRCLVNVTPGGRHGSVGEMISGKEKDSLRAGCGFA